MARGETDYEAQRLANIARNKAILEALGLDDFKIPDAAPKALKAKKAAKSRTAPPKKSKQNGSDDTAVDAPARASKRVKVASDDDGEDDGMRRRSSRNVRRVSYANDGEKLGGGIRARAAPVVSDSGSDFDSDEDDDEDEAEGGRKKRKRGTKSMNGGRRLVSGIVDDTKQRNVAKMGDRLHDPYVPLLVQLVYSPCLMSIVLPIGHFVGKNTGPFLVSRLAPGTQLAPPAHKRPSTRA